LVQEGTKGQVSISGDSRGTLRDRLAPGQIVQAKRAFTILSTGSPSRREALLKRMSARRKVFKSFGTPLPD
jgi:hypothetical protein